MSKGSRIGDDVDDRDSEPTSLSAAEAAGVAIRHISELTTREPVGATSVSPTDDGWLVEVEVVEDRRIPTSADMLALYEVEIDLGGELLSYSRTRRYARGASDPGRGTS
ncbi:gas vesicle protein [Rhodococcus sp. NPDC003318]|uniref:gas vesicle protein GvpO n=1 Tax=Rhodococcus sp. NPDC003318 TaxID=3364503 RepID=UPI0036789FFA